MQQTYMTITCDKCGVMQTFETLRKSCDGPIVVTMDPPAMLEKRGWVSMHHGLRQVDICEVCKKIED